MIEERIYEYSVFESCMKAEGALRAHRASRSSVAAGARPSRARVRAGAPRWAPSGWPSRRSPAAAPAGCPWARGPPYAAHEQHRQCFVFTYFSEMVRVLLLRFCTRTVLVQAEAELEAEAESDRRNRGESERAEWEWEWEEEKEEEESAPLEALVRVREQQAAHAVHLLRQPAHLILAHVLHVTRCTQNTERVGETYRLTTAKAMQLEFVQVSVQQLIFWLEYS